MAWHPFRNVGLKIAALGLGTLLWITVSGHLVQRSVAVPLVYRNVPASVEITGEQLEETTVQVRGPSTQVSGLQPGKDLFAVLDLTGARPGPPRPFPLRTDDVVAPIGVQVTQIDPPTVTLTLERSATAVVPVTPTIDGQPASGFVVGEVSVDPATVTIVGPESRVRELPNAVTELISIDGAAAPLTRTVRIAVADAEVRVLEPRSARVRIGIIPASSAQGERLVGAQVVEVRGLPKGRSAQVSPEAVDIQIRGPRGQLEQLSEHAITPYVVVSKAAPETQQLPVQVDLPEGFTLGSVQPASVAVRIR